MEEIDKVKRELKELGHRVDTLEEEVGTHSKYGKYKYMEINGVEFDEGGALKFGNNQGLYYNECDDMWCVNEFDEHDNVRMEASLEPTSIVFNEGEWYLAVNRDIETPAIASRYKDNYILCIGDDTGVYVKNDRSVITTTFNPNYDYYLITPKED